MGLLSDNIGMPVVFPVKVEGWKRVPLTTQTTKCNDHQEDVFEGV